MININKASGSVVHPRRSALPCKNQPSCFFKSKTNRDKIRTNFRIDPVHFNPAIYNSRKNFLMRSSNKKFGREIEDYY